MLVVTAECHSGCLDESRSSNYFVAEKATAKMDITLVMDFSDSVLSRCGCIGICIKNTVRIDFKICTNIFKPKIYLSASMAVLSGSLDFVSCQFHRVCEGSVLTSVHPQVDMTAPHLCSMHLSMYVPI